jgi:hypothetical protein
VKFHFFKVSVQHILSVICTYMELRLERYRVKEKSIDYILPCQDMHHTYHCQQISKCYYVCWYYVYHQDSNASHNLSRHIRFGTIEATPIKATSPWFNCLQNVIELYAHGRFKVTNALMDERFEALWAILADYVVICNTTAWDGWTCGWHWERVTLS